MRTLRQWYYTFRREMRGAVCRRCGVGLVFSFCHGCAWFDAERLANLKQRYENETRVPRSLYERRAAGGAP